MKRSPSYLWPNLSLLFAATLWGVFWYPLRLFDSAGMPAIWVTLVAFSVTSVLGVVFTFRQWRQYLIKPKTLTLIAFAAGWANVGFLVAVVEGNVIRVILLFYLSPIWTVILGHYILKETISFQAFLIFLVAFAGAMVMLWEPSIGFPWPQGLADWLAISAGFTFALSNVYIRSLQMVSIPVKTTASWLGCIIIAVVWVIFVQVPVPEIPSGVWLSSAALGLFGIAFMTLTTQYGITHMPVYRSAIILLFEIIVTAVSAYVLIDETMNLREWIGGIMVGLSAWMIAVSGKQHE
ncbi:MAG: DMT family transporter [Gammaproteobacteria bacterium]|nr:DMT family transporter [Gammaproteobacteria bacterium]